MVNLHDNCISSFLDLVIEKFSVIIHNDPQRQKLRSSSSKINRGLKITSTLVNHFLLTRNFQAITLIFPVRSLRKRDN